MVRSASLGPAASGLPMLPPMPSSRVPSSSWALPTISRSSRWLVAFAMLLGMSTSSMARAAGDGDDAAKKKILRVVIMDFEVGDGVDPSLARIVADNVVVEVRKVDGLSVVGMAEVRAMLAAESDRQVMGCAEGVSCMAEIADALGADILMTGGIAILDGGSVLSMRRIDQTRAAVAGQVEERLKNAGGEEFLAAVGPAIEKLFPELPLRTGMTRGVPPEQARILNPPPIPVWATSTVTVVAVGALLTGATTGFFAADTLSRAQAEVDGSKVKPVDGSAVVAGARTADGLATVANVAFVASAVIGASAGVMALFTDWDDAAGQRAHVLGPDAE